MVLSRRILLGAGAAFASTALLGTRARAVESAPSVATRNTGDRLLVDVGISGRGPFRFLVDTGADRTLVADEVAKDIGLRPGAPVIVEGIAKSLSASTVGIDRLELGTLSFSSLDVPVLPRAMIGADGYLGLDVMDRHRVVFDFQAHTITLHDPRPQLFGEVPLPDETVIHTQGSSGHLRMVDCQVDGVRVRAFIDSGAELTVGNPALFEQLAKHGAVYAPHESVALTGVTGGTVYGKIVDVPRMAMPGVDFDGVSLVIADLQIFDLWDLADKPALLIGMDALRQFAKVTVDYGRKEYRLEFARLEIARLG
jgi:predicted aspartyl protease